MRQKWEGITLRNSNLYQSSLNFNGQSAQPCFPSFSVGSKDGTKSKERWKTKKSIIAEKKDLRKIISRRNARFKSGVNNHRNRCTEYHSLPAPMFGTFRIWTDWPKFSSKHIKGIVDSCRCNEFEPCIVDLNLRSLEYLGGLIRQVERSPALASKNQRLENLRGPDLDNYQKLLSGIFARPKGMCRHESLTSEITMMSRMCSLLTRHIVEQQQSIKHNQSH